MTAAVLTVNAGSSSLKFALYSCEAHAPAVKLFSGAFAGIGQGVRFERREAGADTRRNDPRPDITSHAEAIEAMLDWLARHAAGMRVAGVGHRIVHGGTRYFGATRIDATVLRDLEALVPIARLHQPYELAAVRAVQAHDPSLCQVACFDTAFHRTQPDLAQRYPLPRALTDSGIRRYGFHGLSYAWIAEQLATALPNFSAARVIVAHLGSGASLCAMQGGRSVATTMGFTALEGLMMGTRAGSIDPGIVLHLIQERAMAPETVSRMLYHESGLLGVSGASADMAALLESDAPHAREAIDLYVYCLVREIGATAACLGGLDDVVFTAGVGEHAAPIRARVCERLGWLGAALDPRANDRHERRIGAAHSRVGLWVIPTDEEAMIARETVRVLRAID